MEHIIQRDLGNDAYKTADYDKAAGHYTLAIGSVRAEIFEKPNKGKLKLLLSSYYTSRAASLTKLKRYDEALEDCKSAIEFDRHAVKAFQRRARVYMQRGMLDEAIEAYDQVIKLDASVVTSDRKHTETTKKKFEGAKAIIEQQRKEICGDKLAAVEKAKVELKTILRFCPDWDEARVLEAEALFYTKEYEEAYQLASSLVKGGLSKDRNLLILRVHLMLNKGKLDDAVKQLWVMSKRNSNCERTSALNEKVELIRQLRDQAEESYKNKDYERAAQYCSTAIDSCPETAEGMVAKLKFSRSAAYASMGSHFRAIDDYADVLQYDPSHLKAYTRCGSSYMAAKTGDRIENCQNAVKSFEQALALSPPSTSTEENIHQKLEVAQKELRKVKITSKDYFAVLGVHRTANLAQVYNAYRMRSLRVHNFKLTAGIQREVDEAEIHHKELSDAYQLLSEAFKNGTINELSQPTPNQRPGNNAGAIVRQTDNMGIGRRPDFRGKRATSSKQIKVDQVVVSPTGGNPGRQQVYRGRDPRKTDQKNNRPRANSSPRMPSPGGSSLNNRSEEEWSFAKQQMGGNNQRISKESYFEREMVQRGQPQRRGLEDVHYTRNKSEPYGIGASGDLVPKHRDYNRVEARGQEGDDRMVLTKKPSLRGTFMSASQA